MPPHHSLQHLSARRRRLPSLGPMLAAVEASTALMSAVSPAHGRLVDTQLWHIYCSTRCRVRSFSWLVGALISPLAVGFCLFARRSQQHSAQLRGTMSSAKDRNKAKAEVRSALAMRGALSASSRALVAVHRRTMRSSGESASDESSRRRRSWRACAAHSSGWIRRGMARST